MNSKTLPFFFTVALTLLMSVTSFAQEATFDSTDPNLVSDNARIANEQVMNGQILTRGIVCETGSCFKDAAPAMGFNQTPSIEPVGTTPAVTPSTKKSQGGKIAE